MRAHLNKLLLLIITVALIGCNSGSDPVTITPVPDDPDPMDPPTTTIVDVASGNDSFETLVAALVATGLDAVLADADGTFTVFAPTDEAFDKLPDGALDALLADTDALSDILLYHVVTDAEIDSTAAIAAAGTTLGMANGDSIGISLSGTTLNVNLSEVILPDVDGGNGVIHAIDTVLIPPEEAGEPTANIVETAVADGNFNTLVTALQTAGLDGALADPDANFTVFAPTDAAFDVLGNEAITALLADVPALTAVLSRHVIAGEAAVDSVTAFSLAGGTAVTLGEEAVALSITDGQLLVNNAAVSMFDIYTTNGIIHVIDAVIEGAGGDDVAENIVDVAREAGAFTTLITALEATGLDAVLSDAGGTFTVFAPTDAAFEALPDGVLDGLLADTDALTDVLLYHVVTDAEINAAAAIAAVGTTLPMANGDSVGISMSGDALNINLSAVVDPDIDGVNGVIHVLDSVLLPPDPTEPTGNIVETAIAAGMFETVVTALTTAGLDDDLADPDGNFTVFAPTDEAFALLGDALAALLADIPALTEVLNRHVIPGAAVDSITAFSLAGNAVATLGGEEVTLSIADGQLLVNNAPVAMTDIVTTNGIIHAISAPIESEDTGGGTELATNGGFDVDNTGWGPAGVVVDDGGNNVLLAEVAAAGNPWDVNVSQVLDLEADASHTLSFMARASVARNIIVGVGQNSDPFWANVETVAITTEWAMYSVDVPTVDDGGNGPFGGADSRIIFDLGAEVGDVWLDDISLIGP